jgi:hypothetical protein
MVVVESDIVFYIARSFRPGVRLQSSRHADPKRVGYLESRQIELPRWAVLVMVTPAIAIGQMGHDF